MFKKGFGVEFGLYGYAIKNIKTLIYNNIKKSAATFDGRDSGVE